MSHFRPKEVLHRAQQSEQEKRYREASSDYALLCVHLRRKNRISDAQKMIQKAIKLCPESGRFYLERAACEWSLGETESSEQSIEQCVRLGLEKKALTTYLDHLKDDLQDFVELRQKFIERWLLIDRTQFLPFLELAIIFNEQGKSSEAKANLLFALKISPEELSLHQLMDSIVEQTGNPEEMGFWTRFKKQEISLDELSLLLGPKALEKNRPLSNPTSELKDLSDLVADLERELELDVADVSDNVEALMNEFIRKSSQVMGGDYQARLDLACAFNEMGRKREAKSELEKIEVGHRLFSQAQILMGNILIQEGSDVAGMGAFQAAIRTSQKGSSEWKEAMYQLVKLQIRFGELKKGYELATELYQDDPNYREVRLIRKEIELKFKT